MWTKSKMHRGWKWNHHNDQLHLVVNGFTHLIYGNYGDEKVQNVANIFGCTLGTKMILPDGREFRLAQASSTSYLQPSYGVAGDQTFVNSGTAVATSAAGAYTVTMTTEEDVTENMFEDGYLLVSTGSEKYPMYRIKEHPAANSASCVITLREPLTLGKTGAAAVNSSQTVTLFRNIYKSVRSPRAEGAVGFLKRHSWIGIATHCPSVTASYYSWLQVSGWCPMSGYDNMGASEDEQQTYFWHDGSIRLCTTSAGLVEGKQICGIVAPCSHSSKGNEDLPGATIPVWLQLPQ